MEKLLKFIKTWGPFLLVGVVIYFFYMRMTQIDVEKTVEDIVHITTRISEGRRTALFRNFDNDTVVYSQYLPIDLEAKMSDEGYVITNRFGSKMNFRDAYKTKNERDHYVSLSKRYENYDNMYAGVGAYMVVFPNLRKNACMLLARVDWKSKIKNFFGMEVSAVTSQEPDNGTEKLNQGLLYDYDMLDYNGPDKGLVATRALNFGEAFRECNCWIADNCTFALKFY